MENSVIFAELKISGKNIVVNHIQNCIKELNERINMNQLKLSTIKNYDEVMKKKEVLKYPEGDIHFVIKNGEEIEQARGFNLAIDQTASALLVVDEEELAICVWIASKHDDSPIHYMGEESIKHIWDNLSEEAKTPFIDLAQSIAENAKMFIRLEKSK